MRFIAEYRVSDAQGSGIIVATVPFDAETVQLAQREVEKNIANSRFDEVVLFQAVSVSAAHRNVSTSSINGGPKVVIGSALLPSDAARDGNTDNPQ